MYKRNKTRRINVGNVPIGGGAPVVVQSMTNTDTRDARATVEQIKRLEDAGCEIVRVSVPDGAAAKSLGAIRKAVRIPLVADIHFDHRLALAAIGEGVDKLRINPGNIGPGEKVAAVVEAAKKAKIPMRIGVNAGSLKGMHDASAGGVRARAAKLVAAALAHVAILEEHRFYDIAVSLKASDVATTIEAYRLFARKKDYPLHLGITEAGSLFRGTVKSACGLGVMLHEGLGDTVRVSLTADPVEEVRVGYQILQSLGLRSTGIEIVSCPTCARCEVDLVAVVNELEERLSSLAHVTAALRKKPLTVAVMGCVVNGPGEAREADIGIAGGRGTGMLFKGGAASGKVAPKEWVNTLVESILEQCKAISRKEQAHHGK